jgi:hypothetical protein
VCRPESQEPAAQFDATVTDAVEGWAFTTLTVVEGIDLRAFEGAGKLRSISNSVRGF